MARGGLSVAGFLATAVTYGPARMGFGLFLPEFRAEFGLSTAAAGTIASAAFLAFLLALPATALMTARLGPRAPVLAGASLACGGMALVAAAGAAMSLVAGVVLAAASAGLAWAPYNAAVERRVPEPGRASTLSVISTGTTIGIALAGLLAGAAVLTELSWRAVWVAFAGAAAAMGLANLAALRGLGPEGGPDGPKGGPATPPLAALARPEARAPYLVAASFGVTSAIYLSFAADRIVAAGGLVGAPDRLAAPIVFVLYGLGGLMGLATGAMEARLGLAPLLRVIFLASAASLALVALAPGSWGGVAASAALQGACVMCLAAVLSFWSLRVLPDLPALGFTAVVMALALGSVVGPVVAGAASDRLGPEAAFLGAATLSLATLPVLSARLAGRHAAV